MNSLKRNNKQSDKININLVTSDVENVCHFRFHTFARVFSFQNITQLGPGNFGNFTFNPRFQSTQIIILIYQTLSISSILPKKLISKSAM